MQRSTPLFLLPLAALLAGGCDDTVFPTEELVVSAEGWDGVQEIFAAQCLTCHSAASAPSFGNLDLETDPCGALVGVTADGYAAELVSAGDSSASVLWHKVAETGTYGDAMPPGGGMSQDNIDLIATWIDDGAACE
ncbi:MAG: c-type cytochrome [Alphaproteobacteria bacterium]|nr:c-type cytochrome [Alphaproteobacteria bacterium]